MLTPAASQTKLAMSRSVCLRTVNGRMVPPKGSFGAYARLVLGR